MSSTKRESEAGGVEQSLDELESKIKLLVARHDELATHVTESLSAIGDRDGADPAAMRAEIETLQEDRERLATHAEFLESRIRELLTRARYAVDA